MGTRKAKITKRTIDSLKVGDTVWDDMVAGFGVRCQKRDKTYFLKKRINGRQRWLTIGKHGEPWTADKARDEARIWIGEIRKGNDPSTTRLTRDKAATVETLMLRYLKEYAYEHKKMSSAKEDEANIKNHVIPNMGTKLVCDLTIADFEDFKRTIKNGSAPNEQTQASASGLVKGGPGAANRCLALMSKAMNLAIKWGIRPDNPVSHITKYKENKIERFLSETEFGALAKALGEAEQTGANLYAIAALRLLIFTGARKGEILTLQWSDVRLDQGQIRLQESKTGAKSIFLNAGAKKVLTDLPRQKNNPYVICGLKEGSHLQNIKRVWNTVKEKATALIWREQSDITDFANNFEQTNGTPANLQNITLHCMEAGIEPEGGLMDVRIHDLRHSFASVGVMDGMSLPMIGKLLGHTQTATTARYAHLANSPVQLANDAIGQRLEDLMSTKNNPKNDSTSECELDG